MISKAEFQTLLTHSEPLSISILMPTRRGGSVNREDAIRFKVLLQQAEEKLVQAGLRPGDARDRLAPLYALLENSAFWNSTLDGLAIFAAGGQTAQPGAAVPHEKVHVFRVELPLPQMLLVGERYYLRPLAGAVEDAHNFYVLALSQNSVRLLRANRFDIQEVPLPAGAPRTFAEAMRFDTSTKSTQWHTARASGGSGEASIFHGLGTDKIIEKRRMLEFCHMIDSGVSRLLRQVRLPLLLAGSEPLLSLYRQANSYNRLEEPALQGNFDRADMAQIHRQALEIIDQKRDADLRQMAARYTRAAGSELASDELEKIIAAARNGQVDTLLIASDQIRWGTANNATGQLEQHENRHNGDEDLLNLAALLTWQAGGQVLHMPSSHMPLHQPIAALFRYAPVPAAG